MVKLQQMGGGQYMVSIPKELVKVKGWKKGQTLLLTFNERGNVEIREVKEITRETG